MALLISEEKRSGQPDASAVDEAVKTTKTIHSSIDPTVRGFWVIGLVGHQLDAFGASDGGIQASSPQHLRPAQPKAEAMAILQSTLGDGSSDPSGGATDQKSALYRHDEKVAE
jgi:hypothetical protein